MPDESTITPPEENNEITLESVDTFDADNLTDDQKTFLEENKGDLTPEQAEKFGITQEDDGDKGDEEEEDEDFEPETRGGKPAAKTSKKEDAGDEGDDDVDPEDEKTIGKVVNKKLGPVAEALREVQSIKDQNEVNRFIRLNPEYAKYEEKALKYMAHDAYKNVPVKNIMAIVAAGDLQKLGAKKEREAASKVRETKTGGAQVRKQGEGKVDWANMSKEDFDKEKARVLQQRR